jgi:hypothetical protein
MAHVPSQGSGELVGGAAAREAIWLGELVPLGRIGRSTWLAATEYGTRVAARRIVLPGLAWPAPSPADVLAATGDTLAVGSSRLIQVAGFGTHGGRLWLASSLDQGVSLRRLLETARLSAPQALLIAADILAAISDLHGSGRRHPRLHAGNVQVGEDGVARLSDWALPSSDAGTLDEARGAAAVLGELAAACQCPAWEGSGERALLVKLQRSLLRAQKKVALHLQAFATTAAEAAGQPMERFELRAELTALVGAASGRPGVAPSAPLVEVLPRQKGSPEAASPRPGALRYPVPSDPASGGETASAAGQAPGLPVRWDAPGDAAGALGADPAAGGACAVVGADVSPGAISGGDRASPGLAKRLLEQTSAVLAERRVLRSLWGLVLAVAVLGLVLGAEVYFLHGPITRDLRALGGSSRGVSATSFPRRTPPVLAPPAAGAIRVVDLRALRPCAGGTSCELTVVIGTRREDAPLRLAWEVEAFDRCSGATVTLGKDTAIVARGQSQDVALESVLLPRWGSLDLVALTTSPAKAASPPLQVPPSGGTC